MQSSQKKVTKIRVRNAQLKDAPVIARFNMAIAQETEQLRLNPDQVHAGVVAVLSDPTKGQYFVAEVDGRVVGQTLITREWSDWRNGWIWWLQSVYVEPAFRRLGVFRALYEHIRTLAVRERVPLLRLYVMGHNRRARSAYEAVGMRPSGYDVWEETLS